jgi:lysophospholipase L1-like esterase
MWEDLPILFENPKILNTGFGGSKASDLLYYIKELVLDFNPSKVVIYEGDNDISSGHKISFILKNIKQIIKKIREKNNNVQIILISAKPSIMRWDLRKKYIQLNNKYKKLAVKKQYIHFADTWTQMLDKGRLKTDIFIEDGLHLNKKGYKIWEGVLKSILKRTD